MKKIHAFTLVELLVVIAIIGVLIALLLPAIQAARESARKTQCANQLKQLAIALHNYHDSLRSLPPGGFGGETAVNNAERGNGLSWHVLILPFIEQAQLYQKFNFANGAATDGVGFDPATTADGSKKFIWSSVLVPTLFCPSADDKEAKIPSRFLTVVGRMPYTIHYAGIAGTAGLINEGATDAYVIQKIGATFSNQEGVLPFQNPINMGAIADGTSNTLVIGEQTGGSCKKYTGNFSAHDRYKGCYGIDGWVRGNGMASSKTLLYGLNTFITITGTGSHGTSPFSDAQLGDMFQNTPFNSTHPAGVNFVFADGSVFFLSESMNIYMLRKLGNRLDGATVDFY